jgi:hypothetical protein
MGLSHGSKNSISFTPFHLVHGIKATLPIECEIPTLFTTIELLPETSPMEKHLLTLDSLDEDRWSSLQNNETAKKWSNPPLTAMSTLAHLTKEISS